VGGLALEIRTNSSIAPPVSREPGIITLDETPIGVFLELEGGKYWIDGTAGACAIYNSATKQP
jgi:hypothetical protein